MSYKLDAISAIKLHPLANCFISVRRKQAIKFERTTTVPLCDWGSPQISSSFLAPFARNSLKKQ